jgi:hypothetical protein
MTDAVRIAMWSGPRNMSTTLMRSFGARADTVCVDEPFYAAWLTASGETHPMQADILADQSHTAAKVEAELTAPLPPDARVVYQKHMTQHMIDGIDRSWMGQVTNVFLIRDPARIIASYSDRRVNPTAADLGFDTQAELFAAAKADGAPLVLDAADILADPEHVLRSLCDALGIGFDRAMLSWSSGPHPSDGVWGAHWYKSIWKSTGFAPPDPRPRPVIEDKALLAKGMAIYERMYPLRIT